MAEGSAHGRVNLVGEHTDYNGGLVLPTPIPQRTRVSVRPRPDRVITLRTDAALPPVVLSCDSLAPRHDWSDHVAGVVEALARSGHPTGGFDGVVSSDVPMGAGLASSAALAVATVRALRDAFGLDIDDRLAASLAHTSEDSFVGAHVGVMDQLVCSLGREGEALLIDTRDLATRALPLSGLDADIVVIDSGLRHEHATGAYNLRRQECADAARALGASSLRDVTAVEAAASLPRPLAGRARHVISENARVLAAVSAIERGDAATLGEIIGASHRSLRDDFEVSLPPIDALVATAEAQPEVYGARLTGGGFGGSVLVLARRGSARAVAARIVRDLGGAARVIVPPGP